MKRIVIAGMFHETNTFLEGKTQLSEFAILRGKELLGAAGDSSPLAGVIEQASDLHWDVLPVIDMRAMPGPVVDDKVVDYFWKSFTDVVSPATMQRADGVFMVLHGAMVSESVDDVEGEILARIRSLPGGDRIPIWGVLDLHANVTARMARLSDGLVAYRENPHTDAKASATRAARLFDRVISGGERPKTVWEHPPIMWPPTGTATATEPMYSLESLARQIESERDDILAVNVLGGFAFAEMLETGLSFTAVTLGDPEEARAQLSRLSSLALGNKALGCAADLSIETAIESLLRHNRGPIVLTEPSDNIGAGAPGDCVGLLKALIDHRVPNSAAIINDPESVAVLGSRSIGERVALTIGGKGWRSGPGPLSLEVEFVSRSDGKFDLEDAQSHLASMFGSRIDMGPCAVVRHNRTTILLTSRKTPPFDLGQLRSQGINPEEQFVIVVKAAVAHRRAYDPITVASYSVDTPGPCSSNLKTLGYLKVQRPIFPLDEL
ncbi:MAG: M81 family metallopeptidase [Acidobacteriia bacterium]|nr:M81 family metallopeptidase [Terriglobia bacterium]